MLTGIFKNTPGILFLVSAAFFVLSFFPVYLQDSPGSSPASYLATFFIALPAFTALVRYLGPKRAGLSLLALSAFAYTIETVGVATGFPYGTFYYGDSLGPKALGLVPYLLPVTYLPLVIGAVAAAWGARGRALHVLGAALLLTLMDGVLDPGAVVLGFWTWPGGGLYYDVPPGNYLGWLFSGVLAALITLFVGRWREPPLPGLLDSAVIAGAFWTGVATFSLLYGPALVGAGIFFYLLYRRSRLLEAQSATSSNTGYKLEAG
ncbi:MAG: carotenoid biosynthesis protein [Rubrobacteraceae bacterium]